MLATSLSQADVEQHTAYLIEQFGDDYPWRWEEDKQVLLSEFASNKKEKIFAQLAEAFPHQWDKKSIRYAPDTLKQQLDTLTKLNDTQVLFTCPATDVRPMLLGIWWPWGHGGTVSLRLLALSGTYQPSDIKQKRDSLFTVIKKLFK